MAPGRTQLNFERYYGKSPPSNDHQSLHVSCVLSVVYATVEHRGNTAARAWVRSTPIVPLRSGISFGWRGYGPPERNGARARISRPRIQLNEVTQPTRGLCDSRPPPLHARRDVRTGGNSFLEGVERAVVRCRHTRLTCRCPAGFSPRRRPLVSP
jgi:hypothetical protein